MLQMTSANAPNRQLNALTSIMSATVCIFADQMDIPNCKAIETM